MAQNTVLIVAPESDLHARGVADALSRRGVVPLLVDFAALNRDLFLTLYLDGNPDAWLRAVDWSANFSELRAVWWRRPRRPTLSDELDEEPRTFVRHEWEHFLESIEPYTTVRWVNPPMANRLADRKGWQLVAAHSVGLRVPRTLISNDAAEVKALVEQGIPLVYKRVASASAHLVATQEFVPEDLDRISVLHNCPAIFQERIDARVDIRVTVIGLDLFAVEIDSQSGRSPLDWRFDHTVQFRPHTLDRGISDCLRKVMQKLGLVFGAIDLRLTPQGEYVFLEINPNGQFLFVELLTQLPLTEKMAEFLTG